MSKSRTSGRRINPRWPKSQADDFSQFVLVSTILRSDRFSALVDRKPYAIAGFSLMFLKYVGEWSLAKFMGNGSLSPWQFLSPLLSQRVPPELSHQALYFALFTLRTLPFVWVGVSLSVRRAADAGISPWWGLLLFVPGLNFLMMLGLCLLPPSKKSAHFAQPGIRSLLFAILVASLYGIAVTVIFTTGFRDYAAGLFMGVPLFMGAVAAFIYNRPEPRSLAATLGVSALAVVLFGGMLLLFALEGALCIAMALPIALFCALLSAVVGRWVALSWKRRSPAPLAVLALLPFGSLVQLQNAELPLYEIQSSVVIRAPREVVWEKVVAFPEITSIPDWFFRLGVAYPLRARIDRNGVGATRYCEFSTGNFIEPITRWEPPARLSFDVKFEPLPMRELTPYGKIYAPHLDG